MAEQFRIDEASLRDALEASFRCLDAFSNADDLNRLAADLAGAGILEAPSGLEILIYPSAVEDPDVALITVLSTAHPNAHVAANSEELRKLATSDLWHGDDAVARTVEIVTSVLGIANGAVAAVRELEADVAEGTVVSSCSCPRCGQANSLRVEYRYDLCGLDSEGRMVLSDDDVLTDIFCLACGKEVDDVNGPDGPVLAAAGGGDAHA